MKIYNTFMVKLSNKFVKMSLSKIPLYHNSIAAVPCEILATFMTDRQYKGAVFWCHCA